jgi:hypothetical protein
MPRKPPEPTDDAGDDLGPFGYAPLPGQMGLFFELKADEPAEGPRRMSPPGPRSRPHPAKGQGGRRPDA